jgi:hypothetical protein
MSSTYSLGILLVIADIRIFINNKEVFALISHQILADFLIKAHHKHDLHVPSTDTHMRKDIGIVSTINKYDGLHIGGDFFFSTDLLTKKDGSSLIGIHHHV